jgi:fibronectin type 3 domain-containing protein
MIQHNLVFRILRDPRVLVAIITLAVSIVIPEQASQAAPAPGLVAAYAFDEGSGLTTADASGNANTGTISGATWTTSGKFGKALSFNGSSNRVDIGDATTLDLTAGMTVEAWVYPTSLSGWRTVILKETSNGLAYALYAYDNAPRPATYINTGGNDLSAAGTTGIPVNTWTHLAATYDATTLRLFVNGTQVGTRAISGSIVVSGSPLRIGGNALWGEYFTGRIDEARIYNRALSQAEIQTDMNTAIIAQPTDTTPPTAPSGLTATAASSSQINLSWIASTDNVGVTGYQVERCQGAGCSTFTQIATTTTTTYINTGLTASTSYSYRVRATDAANNLSSYSLTTSATTTQQTSDTTPPSAPSGLTTTVVSSNQINLSWTASTDNVGVTGYQVERCQGTGCSSFSQIATTTTTTDINTGLTASTSYSYRVRATDAANNLSTYSTIVSATTATQTSDTTPPSAPSGLTTTVVSSSQVNLSWTASTDNVGVTGYQVERCQGTGCSTFTQLATTTTTTYNNTGLTASTSYSYRVRATDAANNLSTYSNTTSATTQAAGLVPAGWYAGDMHVHRSCGSSPEAVSSLYSKMNSQDLAVISLLADMGNGEVQNAVTDLPLVNGQDASVSTAGRIVHWDAEWHWDAVYSQYAHQALGGHIVSLGLSEAHQIWQEYTYPIINWAHQQNAQAISGFVHMQYLDNSIPQSLNCCIPIEYPVEVALGSADFIAEDVNGGDSAMQAYYRLLNTGFRPSFIAGTDYPCGVSELGSLLTYVQVIGGQMTYANWIDGIKKGRTVVSRNGHNEFLDLSVNNSATPGDEIKLTGAGSMPVTVTWTANQNLSGTIELVQNGVVVASQNASVSSSAPASLTATVDFTKSGWLAARRMGNNEHQVQTGAVFVTINNAPVRVSVDDATFYVDWMDNLLTKTSPGGEWNWYFPTSLSQAQARYQAAKAIYQQIALEAAGQTTPLTITTTSLPGATQYAAYSATLAASGGMTPYTWSISSGSLPTGLSLNAGTGGISGTTANSGTFSFTVQAADTSNPAQTATKALSIAVSSAPTLTITTTTMPDGTTGASYSGTLTASGGMAPYTWSISSGSLPAGLSLTGSAGVISGTPSTTGTFSFTARVTDAGAATATKSLSMIVSLAADYSIWPATTVPGLADGGADSSVEVGVKFRTDSNGYVKGIRFYKASTNTGTHTANLWSNGGTLLATAAFTGETASGWQQVLFSSPVAITANTVYVASYHNSIGHYSADENFFATTGVDSPPLHALADGVSGGNGVYAYGSTSSFPNQTWNSANYWVDVVLSATPPPALSSIIVTPSNQTIGTGVMQQYTATGTYSDGSQQNLTSLVSWASSNTGVATITSAGLATAVNSGNTTISATFSGILGNANLTVQVSSLTITTALLPGGTVNVSYTGQLTASGGTSPYSWSILNGVLPAGLSLNNGTGAISGAPSTAGTYSFSVQAVDSTNPAQSALKNLSIVIDISEPILVISSGSNPFSAYYAEILRAEGFNEFSLNDITTVSPAVLATYDVAVLGDISLTSAQVTMLSDWVNAGGHLIAMHPDKKLAGLLGLTDQSSTISDAYLLVNTSSGPGAGIVNQTIQYHGSADRYSLNGASSIATLYTNATTATSSPAVTLRSVGTMGGQAAAFTYDLARSVVYTRQGNPAWSGQERDGTAPIRSDDLFYPNWVDLNKVAIPQADEQQRLLANLFITMNSSKKLLPRFCYFPQCNQAVVVMTGDDHNGGGTAGRFDTYIQDSPPNCSVDNWQCIRSTSYIYPNNSLTNSQAAAYTAAGFEVALHLTTGCADWTLASLASDYTDQLSAWLSTYPSLTSPVTNRTHCIVWSDYVTQPQVELANGIRVDTNYYYWPDTWVNDRPGFFTGSGMPMRFAKTDGTIIDVYQAVTQMTDESGQTYPYTIDTLLDRAIGSEGYYGAFTANMHNDSVDSSGSDAIVSSALARHVPIVSARQMLVWLDGRNASTFSGLAWNGNTLSFSISAGQGANGLMAMVPVPTGKTVTNVTVNNSPIPFTMVTFKGIPYARFEAADGAYQVSLMP